MKPKNNCDAKFVYVVCQIDSIKVVNHDLIIYDAMKVIINYNISKGFKLSLKSLTITYGTHFSSFGMMEN
jgi:hypothetical protein